MANSTVDQIASGTGYLYESLVTGEITASRLNNIDGIRDMIASGAVNGPLAASRGAIATITIIDCNSVGSWSAINVNGINQIGGLIAVTTNNPTYEATVLAAGISAFTPGSGPDLTAYSIGAVVYLVEPSKTAGQLNGVTPVVAVTDVSIQTSVTDFSGGAGTAGSYDNQFGRLYWLNATPAAVPNDITNALDITKYITVRGMQSGMPGYTYTISNDTLTFVDRYSVLSTISILNEAAIARDDLDFINPEGFVLNDIILLQQSESAQSQNVISAPVSSNPQANLYLTGDIPFDSSNGAILMLKYTYDATLGGIFKEVGRSTAATTIAINHGNTIYVDEIYGDDTLAAREEFYPNIYQTADAALAVVQAGDNVVFRKGSYAITSHQLLGVANTHIDLTSGATITGTDFLDTIAANTSVEGGNLILSGDFGAAPGANVLIDVDNFEIDDMIFTGNNFKLNCRSEFKGHGTVVMRTSNQSYITFVRSIFDSGNYCFNLVGDGASGFAAVRGDIYVTEGTYDAIVKCTNSATPIIDNPRYEGKIIISPGVILDYVIRAQELDGGGVLTPYRFIIRGEIHCPVAPTFAIVSGFGGGEVEFIGKIFATNQGAKKTVLSSCDYSTLNKPSKVWLTDCDVYTDTTGYPMYIEDGAAVNRSRIIGKNLKVLDLYAIKAIACDTAGGFYQCLGIFTNAPGPGTNCSNELGTTDIQYDALMM